MSRRPLTDEQLQQAVDLYEQHGTLQKAGRELGLSHSAFRNRLKQAIARGFTTHTLDIEIPEGQTLKGVSTLVDTEGNTILQWIKTKEDTNYTIDAIRSAFNEYEGHAEPTPPPACNDSALLSVYPIADQHNGLLAWGRETGEDYDLEIGAERLRNCMGRLVARAPSSRQALILNLGDWQHTDNAYNKTPSSGNVLDVDSRYFKILTAGVQLMMDCIDLALQKHESVLVRNLPGNHDPHAAVALTVALGAFYSREPRVVISQDPSETFFHRFGQNLLGACHGHRIKPDRMAMMMATVRREDWGRTRHHWMIFGHIHHETVKEVGDCRVESFRTLAANDAWHAASGYCSGKTLTSVTLHEEDGEIERHRVNIPRPLISNPG